MVPLANDRYPFAGLLLRRLALDSQKRPSQPHQTWRLMTSTIFLSDGLTIKSLFLSNA
jgi:hypothetical protein